MGVFASAKSVQYVPSCLGARKRPEIREVRQIFEWWAYGIAAVSVYSPLSGRQARFTSDAAASSQDNIITDVFTNKIFGSRRCKNAMMLYTVP